MLSRLDGVQQTGPDKWLARCPAHPDRSPSLTVKELDDGRVLVHDFGGCDIADVLAAIGLEMTDLFPPRMHGRDIGPLAPRKPAPRFSARDLLELAALESRIVAIAACDLAAGVALSADDLLRVTLAAEILYGIVREVSHG
ncbi:MAG: DNA primase [Methylococcaceae bacterium]|nr:DNA primase [Methylococcaceae bacterium]